MITPDEELEEELDEELDDELEDVLDDELDDDELLDEDAPGDSVEPPQATNASAVDRHKPASRFLIVC